MKKSAGLRKLLLTVHLLFSGILLGCTVVFVILDLTALFSRDQPTLEACYRIMHLLSRTSLRASTIGSIVSGALLSVLTSWGLLQFRWIIAKEALSLPVLALGLYGIYEWSLRGLHRVAAGGADVFADTGYQSDGLMLGTGIALQLVSLVLLFWLSVYKPGGRTAWASKIGKAKK